MNTKKILVIGQGLAGTILSYSLLIRGIDHMVLDNNHSGAATHAAAGIINPITGKRFAKSWMIDELIPFAANFYSDFERFLNIGITNFPNIIRSLNTVIEENTWLGVLDRPGYEGYTTEITTLGNYKNFVQPRLTYGLIRKGLQVNISELITAYQRFLKDKNMLIVDKFNHTQINWSDPGYSIAGQKFDQIIFCEGHVATENPLFRDLPFQTSKGESLKIKIDKLNVEDILKDNIFLVPFGKNEFWTGGIYEWNALDDYPTKSFKEKWIHKLDSLLLKPYSILDHKAGIRPTVMDRRPIIGQHAELSNIYIFNGMGTKGTSLAPFWADRFIDYLIHGKELSDQVNITRFNAV